MNKKTWITGRHSVCEALENKNFFNIYEIFVKNKEIKNNILIKYSHLKSNEVKIVSEKELNNLSKGTNHQGYAINLNYKKNESLADIVKDKSAKINLIILDGIQDQRNIGSIIRTSAVFQVRYILIEKKFLKNDNILLYNTSSGGFCHCKLVPIVNINQTIDILKKNLFYSYGFDQSENNDLNFLRNNLTNKNVFIFGSEDKGLKPSIKNNCDYIINLNKNKKFNILNVSNAVASALTAISIN